MTRIKTRECGGDFEIEMKGHVGEGTQADALICTALSTYVMVWEDLLAQLGKEGSLISSVVQTEPGYTHIVVKARGKGRCCLSAMMKTFRKGMEQFTEAVPHMVLLED